MKKNIYALALLCLLAAPAAAGWSGKWMSPESGSRHVYYPTGEPDFSIIVLGDTQKLTAYPAAFNAMMTYIASKKTEWNIKAVIGVGDVVDLPIAAQFSTSLTAYEIIRDAGIPIITAYGNHDLTAFTNWADRWLYKKVFPEWETFPGYNDYFGDVFFDGQAWFNGGLKTAGDYGNYYILLDVGAYKFIIFALEYFPRDETLAWAKAITGQHADRFVIFTSHALTGTYGMQGAEIERYMVDSDYQGLDQAKASHKGMTGNSGVDVWPKFSATIPKMMIELCGHIIPTTTTGIGHMTQRGNYNQLVHTFRTDFQILGRDTGKFFVRLNFSPAKHTITHSTSSAPSGAAYASHPTTEFELVPITIKKKSMWAAAW